MFKVHFASKDMLPLFQVITPYQYDIMDNDENKKNRRKNKKPEVQVHRPHKHESSKDEPRIHKTFSANFNGHKTKHKHEETDDEGKHEDNINSPKTRIRRKHLIKENERITHENEKLTELVTKKDTQIVKLKDKLHSIQNFNKDILNESNIIKTQYQDLLVQIEEFKTEGRKCTNCEELKLLLNKNSDAFGVIEKQNLELNEDLNMLKNVVYRLNVQLERYQNKLRKTNTSICQNDINIDAVEQNENYPLETNNLTEHSNHAHTPVSWGNVNTHTLGPLLDAYQDTVKEKEDIISRYELELSKFTGKMKDVIDENEILHKKNIEDSESLKKHISELEITKNELKNSKDQNEILIKKCSLKHEKVQELCKIYDHKIDSMRRDYEILQEQYHKSRAELSCIHSKYQSLIDTHDTLKNDRQNQIPLSVHTASVNECKRLFEELKTQYDHEKSKLLSQIKLLEEQMPGLENQIVNLETEKRELQIKSKTAEKQLRKVEHKLAEMQSSLTHTQISRDSCKRQLAKAIDFGKELVTEQESLLKQLSNRSKESKAAVRYGNSMVSKMDSLKTQLKTVQKDAFEELATVEQRLHEQDWSIESMRKEHEREIAILVKEIHDKDEYIAKLVDQNVPAQPYLVFRDRHVQFS